MGNEDIEIEKEKFRPLHEHFWSDCGSVFKLAVPLMIAGSSHMLQETIISVLIGRRNTVLLAAVSVSGIWTGWTDAMVTSGAGQIGALCGMAFGAGNFHLVGIWLQMGLLFVTVMYPPLAMFRFFTGPVLEYFGVPAAVAVPAGIFTVWSGAALIFEMYYSVVWAYYVSQGIVKPDAVINVIFIVLGSTMIWLGVDFFDMGVVGVALALSAKRLLKFWTLVIYSAWAGLHKKTWGGFNLQGAMVADRWKVFLPMAGPAMVGGIAETLHWSINALFAARLGATKSAAFDLIICLCMVVSALVGGVCGGIGSLMARHLGEGKPIRAAEITKVGVVIVYGSLFIFASMVYVMNPMFAEMATKDPLVQKEIHNSRAICSMSFLTAGGLCLICELLCKQGRPHIVFIWMPILNWFVGLPIGYVLSPIIGINGILLGMCTAYFLGHCILWKYLYDSDWADLSKQARLKSEVQDNQENVKPE